MGLATAVGIGTFAKNSVNNNSQAEELSEVTNLAAQNITAAQIDENKISQIIHVNINDPNASDHNSASSTQPLKSLSAALEKAKQYLNRGESTKIILDPGLYREGELVIDGEQLTPQAKDAVLVIEGRNEEVIISGAETWHPSSWKTVKRNGIVYYEKDWLYDFGNNGGAWGEYNPPDVIAHRSEMVFVNGQPLKQVLLEKYSYTTPNDYQGKGTYNYLGYEQPDHVIEPGTFGIAELDENGNKIYLCPSEEIDFSQAEIEVATKRFLLRFFKMENVVLRRLNFQHSANEIEITGAAVMFGPWYGNNEFRGNNILIENCNFSWNNGRGLSLLHQQNVTLRGNKFNYNGFMGVDAHTLLNTVWDNNETNFNNWRGHQGKIVQWALAGAKIHNTWNGVFHNHRTIGNMTVGLWFDIGNRNIMIERLIALHNIRGLALEISPGPFIVHNSLLADDQEVNFLVENAHNIVVSNSIICAVNGGDSVQFTSASSRTYTDSLGQILGQNDGQEVPIYLGSTKFQNNLIVANQQKQALIVQKTGDPKLYQQFLQQEYTGRKNYYWAPLKKTFGIDFQRTNMTNLNQWANYTKETNYIWREPYFVDSENYDFRLKADSPIKQIESNLPTQQIDSDTIIEMRQYLAWVQNKPINNSSGNFLQKLRNFFNNDHN
ncbi:right-handed parallel beta-helix repeat-containing protein [Stanieria cyanosphaera]|uniref:right-handed parallel beta-helix repeat-containing protein n=1 Tax=Stanieria cyanosphaera TaxID=102116 RepID=UPI0006880703|nr:right-handed parallel beta-helix repeat-containing protein [Stanieria cyanosphaera]